MQEREITYRNLLAAYLRLQEVNRQKTVFLASAAHELEDAARRDQGLLRFAAITGSLGKADRRQREILQESKESCDRLVRLVSMFLNYSALESGKLVLHLRENDLRDCLNDLHLPLAGCFSAGKVTSGCDRFIPICPIFKFDYQKVQQMRRKSAGQRAEAHARRAETSPFARKLHFWERRIFRNSSCRKNAGAMSAGATNSVHLSVRIPVAGSLPSFIRKYSRNLCAWILRPQGWVWGLRSPNV